MSARVSFVVVALALALLFAQEQMQTSGHYQSPPPSSQLQTGAETDRNREATGDRREEINSQSPNSDSGTDSGNDSGNVGTKSEGIGTEGTRTTGLGDNGARRKHMMKS